MRVQCRTCGRLTPTHCLPPQKDWTIWQEKARQHMLVCPDCDSRDIDVRLDTKIGRNDLCPCGSGKKYKKCCLDKERT